MSLESVLMSTGAMLVDSAVDSAVSTGVKAVIDTAVAPVADSVVDTIIPEDASRSSSAVDPNHAEANGEVKTPHDPRLGKSRIEMLPLEIIHAIHFCNPDSALLATSKTMASRFTAEALPIGPTAHWVAHTWTRFAAANGSAPQSSPYYFGKADRSYYILSRHYTHHPPMLRRILLEIHNYNPAEWIRSFSKPPLSLASFLTYGGQLSTSLIHHIIHTYPDTSRQLSDLLCKLLLTQKHRESQALIECGVDMDMIGPGGPHQLDELDLVPSAAAARKAWTPVHRDAAKCVCGWEAAGPRGRAQQLFVAMYSNKGPLPSDFSWDDAFGTDYPELDNPMVQNAWNDIKDVAARGRFDEHVLPPDQTLGRRRFDLCTGLDRYPFNTNTMMGTALNLEYLDSLRKTIGASPLFV